MDYRIVSTSFVVLLGTEMILFAASSNLSTVVYLCDDGSKMNVDFVTTKPQSAQITSGDSKLSLPLVPSRSGSKYESGSTSFWIKENEGTYVNKGKSTQCHVAEETAEPLEIKFDEGTTSTKVTGTVKGYERESYRVHGRAGQTLKVNLSSENSSLYIGIQDPATKVSVHGGPLYGSSQEWSGKLPRDGHYLIDIYFMRSEAHRGKTASYSVEVTLE